MTDPSFDLEAFLPYRLNRAAEAVSLRFARHYKALHGMTRPEWRVLAALGHYGRLTASAVGVNSTMHKTKVSRAVYALEQRRWLKRETDPDDRRSEFLELTPEGRRRFAELSGIAKAYQAELLRLLGDKGLAALEGGLSAVEAAFPPKGPKRPRESSSA